MIITSVQNERIKQLKKLHKAKGRKQAGEYLVEGWHLVEEALKSDLVSICLLTQEMYDMYQSKITVDVIIISQEVVFALSQTQTPQPIFAVVRIVKPEVDLSCGKYLLLDGVQDPGNVGTMIRTADAAGFSAVIVGEGTVDIYNDKIVRSMQGSQFHIPIVKQSLHDVIDYFKAHHITVYGTELNDQALPLNDVPYSENCAIIVGNEGNGVSQEVLDKTDKNVYIPILGKAESLNVAVAAGIMMYHFVKNV